jgi:glycosyltransferase involved in cell wall biosynthesis
MLRSNAFVYFHPHSAGGTNPSLVEAMYLELPIITYNVSYNKTTTENKALYFSNEEDIINLVKNTSFTELKKIAAFMKNIADRRYTWQVITKKYFLLYSEC